MSWYLFLDDTRMPPLDTERNYVIARCSSDAKKLIEVRGMPKFISFDHDLGEQDRAIDLVKWLIEQDINNGGRLINKEFKFDVHSSNPIGKQNIESLLNNYLQQKESY